MSIAEPRAYYLIPHLFFVWPEVRGRWYPAHPVAWDDLCGVPFPLLDQLLAAYAEHDAEAGGREIGRLIDTYPAQRPAALRAQARLIARAAGREADLARLDPIVARLPEGGTGFLAETRRVKERVADIADVQRRLDTLWVPLVRETHARLLCREIEAFRATVGGFHEPLRSEFTAAADRWADRAKAQHEQIRAVLNKEPAPQIFRAGDPVDRTQEAFITRDAITATVEREILTAGCPALIVYGRRRMGKSTLVRNLDASLPVASVHIASLSLLDARVFATQESLVTAIVAAIHQAVPAAPVAPVSGEELPHLIDALAACDHWLKGEGRRLLLALDEYENIDRKIGEGVFDEDLLATLRESIQSHRQITWMLIGSHAIAELTHAPWASYMVSARTIEVPPFGLEETRLLLTDPMRHSGLTWDDGKRPRFGAALWGDSGVDWIHGEAGGWPHLVQLIAQNAIDVLNDSNQNTLDATLLEKAAAKAVGAGDTVLRQLLKGESSEPAWAYLTGFRHHDTQSPPADPAILADLHRRLLVVEEGGHLRLRVPLMQRWLRSPAAW
ncbi:MAG: ATP-binding protein [Alphaproteobacteria bacterium]